MEDDRIIGLFFARDERALSETAAKYGSYLKAVAGNILKTKEDSEESISEAYFKIWNSIPPAKPSDLRAYLAKTVRNISLNRVKSECAEKRGSGKLQDAYDELAEIISDNSDFTDKLYLSELLNSFLAELSAEKRTVFVGRYWYFDSISDIARKLNISQSKVKMILLRTRQKLKNYLNDKGVTV